jgi:hypothetical protein
MIKNIVDSHTNKEIESLTGLSIKEIAEFIPPMWEKYYFVIRDAKKACEVEIQSVKIKNCVLYVTPIESYYSPIFKRVAKTLLTDSSRTCLVCGKFGRRRKDQIGFPSLCPAHFLDYINEI